MLSWQLFCKSKTSKINYLFKLHHGPPGPGKEAPQSHRPRCSSVLLTLKLVDFPLTVNQGDPHLSLLLSSPDFLPLHSSFAKHFLLLKLNLVWNTVVVFKGGEEGRKSVSSQRDTQATRGSCRPQTLLRKLVAGSGLHGTTRARPSWGHVPSASARLCRTWVQDTWAAGHLPLPAGARPNPRRAPGERVPGSGIQGPSA